MLLFCLIVLFNILAFPAASDLYNGISCSNKQTECQNGTDILSPSTCSDLVNCSESSIGSDQLQTQILPLQNGSCVLPLHPENGIYTVANKTDARPGQTFDYVILAVSCRRGYGVMSSSDDKEGVTIRKVYCINGKWSQNMPKCVRYCKLEPDPSIRYMCQVSGTDGYKTCDEYVAPGTTVSPVCNSPIYYSSESLLYMKCIAGTWDYVAKCKAECGRVTPEGQQLIIEGRQAKRGELPWHVGIYRKTPETYKLICGGSLISENLILSAAHCFWHDVKKLLPSADFAVAIGKLNQAWNNENDTDVQKSDVKEILIPRLFEGESANFQEDIAMITLVKPFIYKTYVRPVCLNFEVNFDRWQLQQGKIGKVAGWGLTEVNGNPSPVLKVVKLPYVNADVCLNTLPPSFREYITGDKFCAGYTNGTALCKGDSGGGLAFSDKELGIDRYYLRGIVSAAPKDDEKKCNDAAYTTFTKITKHEDFIKQSIATLVKKSCSLSEFQCSDGGCVDQEAECNGKQECADGSDESDYLCKPESTNDLQEDSDACVLPPYPKHGTYAVANSPSARPGQHLNSFVLTISCDEGYGLADSSYDTNDTSTQQVYCVNGAWYQIMPKCVRFCKVQPDPSVHFITCQVPGGGFKACQDYVPPKTIAVPKCNTPDYYSSEDPQFMKCIKGYWDYVAKCPAVFCTLDPEPNTRYMCQDRDAFEFKICDRFIGPGVMVKPFCDSSNNNATQILENMTCTNGTWSHIAKCKTDFCKLETDPSIRYMCNDSEGNELKTCNNFVAVGTYVKPICNSPYYYSKGVLKDMRCTDESWDYVARCQPDCGRLTILKLQALKGEDTGNDNDGILIFQRAIIPWHVGIKHKDNTNIVFTLGTLVRNNVVITGAYHFYDVERQQVNFFTRYIAEVRESGFLDTTNHVQQSDVKSINVLSSYRGRLQNFMGDIAVLTLATPFSYNSYVSPVCLDFDIDFEEQQLTAGNTGKVGFWGQLDKNEVSVIDTNTCINNLPTNLTRLAFGDKICVSYAEESGSFLYGNFGSGIFFPRNESGIVRYYLRGILHDGCYSHTFCNLTYAWSTKINKYVDFIQQYIN